MREPMRDPSRLEHIMDVPVLKKAVRAIVGKMSEK